MVWFGLDWINFGLVDLFWAINFGLIDLFWAIIFGLVDLFWYFGLIWFGYVWFGSNAVILDQSQ